MTEILFSWQGIAGTAIVISIIIAGICLGFGRAFSLKKLERFGIDELLQSIINAAILGFAVTLSTLVISVGDEFMPQIKNLSCDTNVTPSSYMLCIINETNHQSFNLSQDTIRIQNTIGYYQSLELHFGNFSIQPLINMGSAYTQLANLLYSIQFSFFISSINAQFLSFISSNWFGVIFAAGLVLRSIFLSRKFGAFLIAVSISLIIFYPLMLLMFQPPFQALKEAKTLTEGFLTNSSYQTIPIIDLNNNNAIAEKIYNMSFMGGNDFVGDITLIIQQITHATALLFFYSIIVPLFALIAITVLIKELSITFAGEIATELSQV